ncbi:MAG: hypothetical protein WBE76_07480 [Terracidiphilus sp.]
MHVHLNQFDPSLQMNALNAAARAEAKWAAEQTRKKLLSSASALAGEYDIEADYIVKLSEDDASQENPQQRNRQHQRDEKKSSAQAASDDNNDPFSDWA